VRKRYAPSSLTDELARTSLTRRRMRPFFRLSFLLLPLTACVPSARGDAPPDDNASAAAAMAQYPQNLFPPAPTVPPIPRATDPLLPDAPSKALGIWQGDFSVSLDGASNYRLPLEFARGRAGIEPALTVAYSSDASDGTLGVGWSLNGISKIHRCPRTYSLDLTNKAVTFLSDDAFCMDGVRLLEVPANERTTTRGDVELAGRGQEGRRRVEARAFAPGRDLQGALEDPVPDM